MWQSIRFPEGLNYEDIYVNMDVISYAKRMTAISDVLYFYEVGKHGSIMQTKSVSNKYSVLTHHIRNFQKVSEIKDYFFLQKLYYYTALAAWDDWAFLSKKTENFSFSKAQELRNKITNNEFYRVNMDSLQIQLEFYSSKAFMEYEKIQILEKECLDAKKNKKELIRYIVYVVCLARSINQEDKDDKTMLSVLLDMGRHIEQYGSIRQKLLLLANRYELTPILKMEGSHLIRKGI